MHAINRNRSAIARNVYKQPLSAMGFTRMNFKIARKPMKQKVMISYFYCVLCLSLCSVSFNNKNVAVDKNRTKRNGCCLLFVFVTFSSSRETYLVVDATCVQSKICQFTRFSGRGSVRLVVDWNVFLVSGRDSPPPSLTLRCSWVHLRPWSRIRRFSLHDSPFEKYLLCFVYPLTLTNHFISMLPIGNIHNYGSSL